MKLRFVALLIGAFVFLFPFYYMLIGSLQAEPDPTVSGAFPSPGNLTGHNYAEINKAIHLGRSLLNSGIFTGGVILGTLVFGVLAGYALIVRSYGLADSYLGMTLPFLINSTAVFVFRQYFLQLPAELFDAARIDGASELGILWRVAVPLVRPALLTGVLLTFIGPWNEFLWPFLITKQQDLQPLAVSLSNYLTTVSARAANPFGAVLAGACVLAAPAVALFIVFQRRFISTNLSSGVKG